MSYSIEASNRSVSKLKKVIPVHRKPADGNLDGNMNMSENHGKQKRK